MTAADSTGFVSRLCEGFRMTGAAEWIAIAAALIYVILAAHGNKWCWSFGIISAGIYTWFNYSLTYYYDAGLSAYYVVIGFYGWYAWTRKGRDDNKQLMISSGGLRTNAILIIIGIAATFLLGYLAAKFTPSTRPYFDASLTSFSLIATWMTTKKLIENWVYWVIIDAGYTALYFYSDKPSTATLNLIYTIIAIFGYLRWKKEMRSGA